MKTELFTIYAPGVEPTLCAIVGEQAIYYSNGTKHICNWREVIFHIMPLEINFLSDYKVPEPDYDERMEQEMDDTMRRAAEDYERQLIENSEK